jgi:pSer/pThr/pTyr-binding forkhead associated (FHA) protein
LLKLMPPDGAPVVESRGVALRFGRDPDLQVVVRGDAARVVSVRHAELRFEKGAWLLADLGSRNGTYLNGKPVSTGTPVKDGDMIRLGESGPQYQVVALVELEATLAEHPGLPVPAKEAEQRSYGVTLLAANSGKRFEARGTRIRLGRGRDCEVQPVESSDTIVSRVHAELTVGTTGGLVVRDAESKNGTYLNGERITQPMPVRLGDKIMLGQGGPVLLVEGMGTAPRKAVPRPPAAGLGKQTIFGMIGAALRAISSRLRRGGRRRED